MPDDRPDYNDIIGLIDKRNEEEKERRKRQDWITRLPNILALISAVIVFAVWLMWNSANPNPAGTDWGWLSFFGEHTVQVRPWPRRIINIAYIMLLVSIGLCLIAIMCNKVRMRRKGDRYSWAVFFVGSIAVITFAVFLYQFIPLNIIGRW